MYSIEIIKGDEKVLYNADTNTITHLTRSKVLITCEVPSNWAATRVFQFMDTFAAAMEGVD